MIKFAALLIVTYSSIISVAFADMSLADYMNQPANPMNAEITVNDDLSSSADIDENGGKISLTVSDGSVFELTIPAGALSYATTITMNEIISFDHPSMSEASGTIGVQLSPGGTLFAKPVTLKINSKDPIETSSLVPITADDDGKDVRIATVSPNADLTPNSVELTLYHFSPYVLTGSLTLRETILRAFNSITASRLQAWTADQLLKMKQNPNATPFDFDSALTEYFEKVVKVQAFNVESCEGGIEAQRTLLSWIRQNNLLNIDPDSSATYNFKSALTSRTAKLCHDRAITACYQDHRPFEVIQFALGVERQAQLLGVTGDGNAAELIKLAEKCAHFEFEMKSTFTINGAGESKISAESKIKVGIDNIYQGFVSEGTVQVTAMSLDLDSGADKCVLTSLIAPEKEVSMKMDIDTRFDQSLGVFVKGLYPKGVGKFTCSDDSDPPDVYEVSLPPGGDETDNNSYWGGLFFALHSQAHANEYNVKKDQYEFYKWDVLYGDLFATKKYNRTLEMIDEDTAMTIYHRPLPL